MKINVKNLCIFIPIVIILIFVFVSILTPKAKYMTGKDTHTLEKIAGIKYW